MTAAAAILAPDLPATPPLENGDQLNRDEFERRYHAMTDVKKAELVEGLVYMPSPVRMPLHGRPHATLVTWAGVYAARTPGLDAPGDNPTVRLDDQNVFQPDIALLLPPRAGGTATIDPDLYISGPPDLVVEVAASSVSIDLHVKKEVYRRHGVREYLVWRVLDGAIDWFMLRDGSYQTQSPDGDGLLKSAIFPGLWLDWMALLKGDLPAVLRAVEAGANSPEHAQLVQRLA